MKNIVFLSALLCCTILYVNIVEGTPLCGKDWSVAKSESGPRPRDVGAHTMVANGKDFLLFGGFYEGFTEQVYRWNNNLWKFDTKKGKWELLSTGKEGPSPRGFHGAAMDDCDEKMYVYGGVTYPPDFSNITIYSDFWSYDVDDDKWTKIKTGGANPGQRTDFGLTQLNGKIYLFGGVVDSFFTVQNDLWVYDPDTKRWTELNPIGTKPTPRNAFQFRASDSDNKIYLYGGENPQSDFGTFTDTWVYDVRTNKWTNITPSNINDNINPPVNSHLGSAVIGDKFLIFGGEAPSPPGAEAECGSPFPQNPTNNFYSMDINNSPRKWKRITTQTTPPKTKRHAGSSIGQCFCFYGGFDFTCPPGQTFNNQMWCIRKPNY
jgi:N-acetylneuraminic acid mutarotase